MSRKGRRVWNQFTPEEFATRFWARVKIGSKDECWEWTGCRIRNGYGRLGYKGKQHLTHRIAWELTNGTIPDGLCILHKCDNPPCCNPDHHFLGTKLDNMLDMRSKGRENYLTGEDHGSAKLNAVQVADILSVGKSISSSEQAKKYGVSKSCIKHVWSGRTHKKVQEGA